MQTLNLPAIKPKEIADEAEYLEHDVQDAVYLAALKLAYDMAKMFVGTFSSSVEGKKTKQLKIKLEKFYFRVSTVQQGTGVPGSTVSILNKDQNVQAIN